MSHTIRRRRSHNRHQRGELRCQQMGRERDAVRKPARPVPTVDQVALMATDHAVVRWMTRVVGVDVRGAFIEQLLTPDRAALVSSMQNGRVRVNDTSIVLIVRGGVVASVISEGDEH